MRESLCEKPTLGCEADCVRVFTMLYLNVDQSRLNDDSDTDEYMRSWLNVWRNTCSPQKWRLLRDMFLRSFFSHHRTKKKSIDNVRVYRLDICDRCPLYPKDSFCITKLRRKLLSWLRLLVEIFFPIHVERPVSLLSWTKFFDWAASPM